MTETRVQTVMRRKAEAGRPAADGSPVTAERAIVQALSKVAQELFSLPLQVLSIAETRRSLADLPEALEELSLLAIIEGPEEGLGLIALPPATLAALIEVQTMGALAKEAPAPRRPTRIDATMAADFIDAVLAMIEETLAETEAVVWAGGFRYSSYLDDPRPLGLLLEDMGYRVWQMELGFGAGGDRRGNLLWAVPVNGRGQALRRLAGAGPGAEGGAHLPGQEEGEWAHRLENAVLGAAAELNAVLHRLTLPLAAVLALRPGQDLPLPPDALENLTLEGAGRRRLSAARLGQHRGQRALRLIEEDKGEAEPEAPAAPPKARRVVPPPFEAGQSPFKGKSAPRKPQPPLDRIDSPAYDPQPGGLDGLGDLGGLGGLGGLDPAPLGMAPLGMALDGFGGEGSEEDLPPMKIGSAF